MIEYRLADAEDIETLVSLRVEFLCEGKDTPAAERDALGMENRRYFKQAMAAGSFIAWVASADGQIVATSGATLYLLPPNQGCVNGKTAYISNMYTKPAYRGQGVATKLFALIVEAVMQRGCGRILLHATDMGRPIYEKYGFEAMPSGMCYDLKAVDKHVDRPGIQR